MASTLAQKAKEQGNFAFQAGDFPAAIGHYTTAVLADRTDPTYPLNRAAAYLKLGKNEDAERDCTTVLALKPGHVKGLFRRAQARTGLGKLGEAQADLQGAIKIEPGNNLVKAELKKVEEALVKSKKQNGSTSTAPQPKRRRVPIEIVEASEIPGPAPALIAPSDTLTALSTRSLSASASPAQTLSATQNAAAAVQPPPSSTPSPASFQAAQQARQALKPRVGGGIFRSSGEHTIVSSKSGHAPGAPTAPIKVVTSASGPQPSFVTTEAPLSLFAFTRRWESLMSPSERWGFICQIPAQSLPTLFQASLEPSLLVSILETFQFALSSPSVKEIIRDHMTYFTKVPRFNTVTLFLGPREKDIARTVCDAVGVQWSI